MSQPEVAVRAMPDAEASPPMTAARLIPGACASNAASTTAEVVCWVSGASATVASQPNLGISELDQLGTMGDDDDRSGPRQTLNRVVGQPC